MSIPLHAIDLGPEIPAAELDALLRDNGASPLVRGILQTLRDTSFHCAIEAREGVMPQNLAFIATKLGAAEILESVVISMVNRIASNGANKAKLSAQERELLT